MFKGCYTISMDHDKLMASVLFFMLKKTVHETRPNMSFVSLPVIGERSLKINILVTMLSCLV